jgi:hypothetical protein
MSPLQGCPFSTTYELVAYLSEISIDSEVCLVSYGEYSIVLYAEYICSKLWSLTCVLVAASLIYISLNEEE